MPINRLSDCSGEGKVGHTLGLRVPRLGPILHTPLDHPPSQQPPPQGTNSANDVMCEEDMAQKSPIILPTLSLSFDGITTCLSPATGMSDLRQTNSSGSGHSERSACITRACSRSGIKTERQASPPMQCSISTLRDTAVQSDGPSEGPEADRSNLQLELAEHLGVELDLLDKDPTSIIEVLTQTAARASDRAQWMIVGAHYRRMGNPSAALSVVAAMVNGKQDVSPLHQASDVPGSNDVPIHWTERARPQASIRTVGELLHRVESQARQ